MARPLLTLFRTIIGQIYRRNILGKCKKERLIDIKTFFSKKRQIEENFWSNIRRRSIIRSLNVGKADMK